MSECCKRNSFHCFLLPFIYIVKSKKSHEWPQKSSRVISIANRTCISGVSQTNVTKDVILLWFNAPMERHTPFNCNTLEGDFCSTEGSTPALPNDPQASCLPLKYMPRSVSNLGMVVDFCRAASSFHPSEG